MEDLALGARNIRTWLFLMFGGGIDWEGEGGEEMVWWFYLCSRHFAHLYSPRIFQLPPPPRGA